MAGELSPAAERVVARVKRLRSTIVADPMFATSEDVTAFVFALCQELDAVNRELNLLREELRRPPAPGSDHTHDPLEHTGT